MWHWDETLTFWYSWSLRDITDTDLPPQLEHRSDMSQCGGWNQRNPIQKGQRLISCSTRAGQHSVFLDPEWRRVFKVLNKWWMWKRFSSQAENTKTCCDSEDKEGETTLDRSYLTVPHSKVRGWLSYLLLWQADGEAGRRKSIPPLLRFQQQNTRSHTFHISETCTCFVNHPHWSEVTGLQAAVSLHIILLFRSCQETVELSPDVLFCRTQ